MADAKSKKETEQATTAPAADAPKAKGLGIRLMPVDNSDQPVVANYTTLNVAPGMVFIDFGFLEPAMLTAFQIVFENPKVDPAEILSGLDKAIAPTKL